MAGVGAGSRRVELIILSVPSSYPTRIFPLGFRHFPPSLAAPPKKAKFRVALREALEGRVVCTACRPQN